MDNLASVMFANLQRVVFCRKTIILIAIGQFTGKRREFILHAIAAIGLIPGNLLLKAGTLLRTGPTRTNVMDMAIMLVRPK